MITYQYYGGDEHKSTNWFAVSAKIGLDCRKASLGLKISSLIYSIVNSVVVQTVCESWRSILPILTLYVAFELAGGVTGEGINQGKAAGLRNSFIERACL